MVKVLLWALQLATDTLAVQPLSQPPRPDAPIDSTRLGSPQVRLRTRQGTALIWLLRSTDSFFVAAIIPDSTPYWGDDFVLSLDTRGDGGPTPQHDDFQLYFHRVLDSSVVFRGRSGRWEPPRNDPDWRVGKERSGGGWEVSARQGSKGWTILIRLDPAWFVGDGVRRPRMAVRVYDDSPSGCFPGRSPQVGRRPPWWSEFRRSGFQCGEYRQQSHIPAASVTTHPSQRAPRNVDELEC
jgi:hypothetical protein